MRSWATVVVLVGVVVSLAVWYGPDERDESTVAPAVSEAVAPVDGRAEEPTLAVDASPRPDRPVRSETAPPESPPPEAQQPRSSPASTRAETTERPAGRPSESNVPAPSPQLQSQSHRPTPAPSAETAAPSSEDRAQVERIREGFAAIRPDLRECYELLLSIEPAAADRLIFELLVTRDSDDPDRGLVELLAVESDALVLEDVECFAETVETMRLPTPNDGEDEYRVRYPVILNVGD